MKQPCPPRQSSQLPRSPPIRLRRRPVHAQRGAPDHQELPRPGRGPGFAGNHRRRDNYSGTVSNPPDTEVVLNNAQPHVLH